MKYVFTALAVGSLLAAAPTKEDEAKKEVEKLQGTWHCVSAEAFGVKEKADETKGPVLTVEKDTFTVKVADKVIMKGTYKLDPSQTPKAIDLTITESSEEKEKGKVMLAIYEVDKNSLKLAEVPAGSKNRPKEFTTKEESLHIVFTYKRERP
jgi:uncharacterized protein (TIGR03067 family)